MVAEARVLDKSATNCASLFVGQLEAQSTQTTRLINQLHSLRTFLVKIDGRG